MDSIEFISIGLNTKYIQFNWILFEFNSIEYYLNSIQLNIIWIQFNIKLFEGIKFELKFSVINNEFDIELNRNLEALKYL